MLQKNFVSDVGKTARTNFVTRKYVKMNGNKHIYNVWMRVFCFAFSAVQFRMGMLATIIWQRHSTCQQVQKNKEIILHFKKKKRNMFKKKGRSCWAKQGRTSTYFLCFNISGTLQ